MAKSKALSDEEPPPASYHTLKDLQPLPLSAFSFSRIPKRYIVCFLILLSNILCYADRTNISIAVLPGNIPLANDFETGQVLAGFFYGSDASPLHPRSLVASPPSAVLPPHHRSPVPSLVRYIFTQFIGGILANRYGGKPVLMCGVIMWVLCDALTVPASTTFPLLMLARVGMGLGEGVNFPSDHAMVAAWFVPQERSGFLTIISAGVDIGTIVSSGLSPIIAERQGWKWIYGIYCFLGLAWLAAFALLGSSKPEWHPTITAEERDFILANRSGHSRAHAEGDGPMTPSAYDEAPSYLSPTSRASVGLAKPRPVPRVGWLQSLLSPADNPVPWRRLLSSPSLWGIVASHVCFNYGFYVMLSWLPKYYVSRGTSLAEGGFFSISMPYIAGAIGGPVSGYLSNRLVTQGWRIRDVRILMNSIGSVGASAAMFLIAFYPPQSTALATAALSLGYFFFRFSFSGYWANMVDIGHAHAGEIMGISNTLATVPGMVGNTLTGWILDRTGNWSFVFFLAGAAYVLAGISFYWLCDDLDLGEAAVTERRRGQKLEEEEGEEEVEDDDDGEFEEDEDRAINVGRSSFL